MSDAIPAACALLWYLTGSLDGSLKPEFLLSGWGSGLVVLGAAATLLYLRYGLTLRDAYRQIQLEEVLERGQKSRSRTD